MGLESKQPTETALWNTPVSDVEAIRSLFLLARVSEI